MVLFIFYFQTAAKSYATQATFELNKVSRHFSYLIV